MAYDFQLRPDESCDSIYLIDLRENCPLSMSRPSQLFVKSYIYLKKSQKKRSYAH